MVVPKKGVWGMVSDAVIRHQGKVIAVYPDGILPLEPPLKMPVNFYLTSEWMSANVNSLI